MFTFTLALVALVLGYFVYGKYISRVFGPDPSRPTPAIAHPDGVDYIAMPTWKVFMIQFLNIAGTGPIFGAIMGAKFGPVAYLWIIFGCIFAGAVHDYLSGMLSLRNDGAGLPELIGKYLGKSTKMVMLVFSILLLVMVGVVFVYSPSIIMTGIGEKVVNLGGDTYSILGSMNFWIVVIFLYYILATMLPIDKIIGKIYPLFAFSLLFMAVALLIGLYVKFPALPELWDGLGNMGAVSDASWTDPIFPCLFITIACGAISGFHATQSPLMARCLKSEKLGRPVFYGSMITEGIVALIWATVAMYFFYQSPSPGYNEVAGAAASGYHTAAPAVVSLVCNDWLGILGGILALLGVVAAPITSGDTAFRSARLIIAEFLHISQRPIMKRIAICIPLFGVSVALLFWQIDNPDGFNIIWQYFGWANQTLSVFTLWMLTVYLVREHKPYIITLVPALFMTTVCATYIFVSPQALGLAPLYGYGTGCLCFLLAAVWFFVWRNKETARLKG